MLAPRGVSGPTGIQWHAGATAAAPSAVILCSVVILFPSKFCIETTPRTESACNQQHESFYKHLPGYQREEQYRFLRQSISWQFVPVVVKSSPVRWAASMKAYRAKCIMQTLTAAVAEVALFGLVYF